MFDVGFAELFLLALIGLLVLGPERLPRVAHTLGGLIRQARQSWMMMRRSIESELKAAQIDEPVKEIRESLESIGRDISSLPNEIAASVNPTADQSATDQSATDQSATDQSATDQSATDQPGTDQSGTDQSGPKPAAGEALDNEILADAEEPEDGRTAE